jgi:hypothetical protein
MAGHLKREYTVHFHAVHPAEYCVEGKVSLCLSTNVKQNTSLHINITSAMLCSVKSGEEGGHAVNLDQSIDFGTSNL